MKNRNYKDQVRLLLSVLPDVAKEQCFALHGGTAINLFIRNMPRLSVDIDLTYCPIEDRSTTLQSIDEALERIQRYVEATLKGARVRHQNETRKLLISHDGAEVKLEVNTVSRGLLSDPIKRPLCEKTQAEFDAFALTPIVPLGQLYGGKICAAMDRQHPRDLFDIKYLLENEGITDEIRKGFLFCLLCSDRPINEVISPNFQDQRQAMDNQFKGMSLESFSYEDFERTRETLIETV
ncbi:nucleotidyl transferase AbiEii/AbiGii toxin family protein, partial [uncultured Kiloniella sp.]|uniref:nucleotidyl transferase AbiEii/AbiGii toxin family protein n=1 Tax=uncultured Kiloniella sp. TaxID=1133091 RepID=UPI00262554BE